jgi:hypothetical protein
VDWDWHLIVEVATLVVAAIAVILLLVEEDVRRRRQGLPTMPLPHCRVTGDPTGDALPIEACNDGAAAPCCFVAMQAGKLLYAGSFRLGEQSAWAPQMLHVIDSLDDTTEANVLFSVARNVHGLWSAVAPYRVIQAMPSSSVPFEVVKLLKRATGRKYLCAVAPDGHVTITAGSPGLRPSAELTR